MNNAGLGISSITSITMTADDRNSSYNVIAFDQAILGDKCYDDSFKKARPFYQ